MEAIGIVIFIVAVAGFAYFIANRRKNSGGTGGTGGNPRDDDEWPHQDEVS